LKYFGLNANRLAGLLGYKGNAAIYHILNERNGISESFAYKVSNKFPEINLNWLLMGEGSMLKDDGGSAGGVVSVDNVGGVGNVSISGGVGGWNGNGRLLKLYDAEASGGFGSFEAMIGENKVVGEFVVPSFSAAEWMIYVKGSSMYPKYSSGDIVACRQIRESRFIQWNKVYVVATREQGLLIKRLMPGDREGHIKAVSDNRDYPPFDVPEDEILGLALVLGVIRLE